MAVIQQILLAGAPLAVPRTYATWNPADKYSDVVLSSGNLSATNTFYGSVRATIKATSGKWYWEITVNAAPLSLTIGFATSAFDVVAGYAPGRDYAGQSGGYAATGDTYASNVVVAPKAPYGSGDVIGVAMDIDSASMTFFKNNVPQWGGSTPPDTWFPCVGAHNGTGMGKITANFGATPFTYSPPAGYNAGLYI